LDFENIVRLEKAVLQPVEFPSPVPVSVFMKRLDLIHPYISGNKWFKLKYNLKAARENGYDTLLTFGGAYSNHIHAASAAGKEFGFKTIGLIRGEEHLPLNPTLAFAADNGMRIHYLNRSEYRNKHLPEFTEWVHKNFGGVYIIPEGGTNPLAVQGASEIPGLIGMEYDYIAAACGTAGTISGIIAGLAGRKKVLGFAVLKGASFLIENAGRNVFNHSGKTFENWSINLDYHFGGYAKFNRELIRFISQFEEINGIPLDPVYTGKMMYGIYDLAVRDYFTGGKTIVALHTGGIQGKAGMEGRIKRLLTV
jgi:1-aminocyclopropane-1-carboxylate deaminase/D-cysteine desulfhydrase-like pyridoxal-dependent ACC family enzyme